MGEAKRRSAEIIELKQKSRPWIRLNTQTMAAYDNTSNPFMSIKIIPDSLRALQRELLNHQDIVLECSKPEWSTFELALGRMAQMLNIVLDGEYEPNGLFTMLYEALKNRSKYAELNPHMLAEGHGLKNVEIQETADSITLKEIASDFGLGDNAGPYTICDSCITSYDCCAQRACRIGKPAVQLGNTTKVLNETLAVAKRNRMEDK